jgi:hypothetical protein
MGLESPALQAASCRGGYVTEFVDLSEEEGGGEEGEAAAAGGMGGAVLGSEGRGEGAEEAGA